MTAANFPACLAFTLQAEGGYVDNPADPGGATNMGITLATYRAWMGNPLLTAADIQTLSVETASNIYAADYWMPVRGASLPSGIDLMVFDMGVNAGVSRSAKILQRVAGVVQDGRIGPHTLAAATHVTVDALYAAHCAYYTALGYPTFLNGWLHRAAARQAAAAMLIG